MVGMVKQCVLAEVFLELAKQASRKTGLLLEVYVVEAPLVLKESSLCRPGGAVEAPGRLYRPRFS